MKKFIFAAVAAIAMVGAANAALTVSWATDEMYASGERDYSNLYSGEASLVYIRGGVDSYMGATTEVRTGSFGDTYLPGEDGYAYQSGDQFYLTAADGNGNYYKSAVIDGNYQIQESGELLFLWFPDGEGSWSTTPPISSPEPTSGLLLLIGMAGLALKRKSA